MNTLSHHARPVARPRARVAQAWMNPYAAGFLLGLVLLASYLVTGRGLGATAGFAAVATWATGLVSAAHVQADLVHAKYWNDGAPLLNWTLFLLLGAFVGAALSGWQAGRFAWRIERGPHISDRQRLLLAFAGGFIAAWGAKLAKGCTSGQALTGSAVLDVGGLFFMLAVFVSAFGLAHLVRREWL
ncbi:MAG: YeeE/YedE family protein [Burkholderiales bacterium]|nr:YeeE/YedE family protein [Burkholderiales bacterium]